MTIEVPWPWWVSTAVAVAVAAASLVALVLIRRPVVRGVLATIAVQALAVAAVAPLLMSDAAQAGMSGMSGADGRTVDVPPTDVNSATDLPFTFYFTRYEFLGDPGNPSGVRYRSDGRPFAEAPDGSRIVMTGAGGWDPATARAEGGGNYAIANADGDVTGRGTWTVDRFVSFEQVAGWWGFPNWREEGWQGPPGSASFSGFLEVRITLSDRGEGLLTAWCLMPGADPRPGHRGDGITVTGPGLDFSDYRGNEASLNGVMFYDAGVSAETR